jgi:capsular polysaccharide export protein
MAQSGRIHVVGMSIWRSYLEKIFPGRCFVFYKKNPDIYSRMRISRILRKYPEDRVFLWGYKTNVKFIEGLRKQNASMSFLEDGFIRSMHLGATGEQPLSITMDSKAPYFDASRETDLECLLNNYDFDAQPDLIRRALRARQQLIQSGASKYNCCPKKDMTSLYETGKRKRVLVLGQVPGDASIIFGCKKPLSGSELVLMAKNEHPEAEIIYKPHPALLYHQGASSEFSGIRPLARILSEPVSLASALDGIDQVYTLTSLSGFEALLRGIKVTCIGAPFYSNWGLTDDRQKICRRQRRLTLDQLFAGAYLLYAKYMDPASGKPMGFEDALRHIEDQKKMSARSSQQALTA